MRLVATADWHGDAVTLGVRRKDEIVEAVKQSVTYAIRTRADVYVMLGDLSDPDTGGDAFWSMKLAISAAIRLREAGVQSIWLRGNHDVWEDGTNACALTPLSALEALPEAEGKGRISVITAPRVVMTTDRPGDVKGTVLFLGLPFTPVSDPYDPAAVAREFFKVNKERHRTVVLSHLAVPGVVAGEETNDMPRGRDILYPVEETAPATLRLQGHYHKRQTVHLEAGPPMYIPGTLARLKHSDEKHEPGFLAFEI